MHKLKNVRPGILIIADAGLKLTPGEEVTLDKLSRQTERAVASGYLARVETDAEAKPAARRTGAQKADAGTDEKQPVEDKGASS